MRWNVKHISGFFWVAGNHSHRRHWTLQLPALHFQLQSQKSTATSWMPFMWRTKNDLAFVWGLVQVPPMGWPSWTRSPKDLREVRLKKLLFQRCKEQNLKRNKTASPKKKTSIMCSRCSVHQETYVYLLAPCTRLYKVKNVKSSQGEIVGLRWSQGQSRFCTGLSHNHKVKT